MSVHGGFGNSFERFGSVFERLSMIFVTLVEVVGVFKDFLLRLMTFKDILGTFVHGFGVFVCVGGGAGAGTLLEHKWRFVEIVGVLPVVRPHKFVLMF